MVSHGVSGTRSDRTRAVLMALCAAGVLWLGWRGVWRGLHASSDLAIVYGSARAWLLGMNPYDSGDVAHAWLNAGGGEAWVPGQLENGRVDSSVFLYPPTTFAVMAPVAAMPWHIAKVVWLALSMAMWWAAAASVAAVAGLRRYGPAWWGVMAGAAWLAPAATSLNVGQLALVSVGLTALGRWAGEGRADLTKGARGETACGVLEGLATALKPQVAGLFLAYDAGRGRIGRVAWGTVVIGAMSLIGIGRMVVAHVSWWPSWRENLGNFAGMSNGDPTLANPLRFQIISLAEPLHGFTDNRAAVRAAVWGIAVGLCAIYFVVDWRRGRVRGEGRGEMVSLSMVAVVSLMIVYHRFYDAALLVWPLALAVREIGAARSGSEEMRAPGAARAPGLVLLALVAVFAMPGSAMLAGAAERGWVPAAVSHSWAWEGLIVAHEGWAILAMACVLIWMRASRGQGLMRKPT